MGKKILVIIVSIFIFISCSNEGKKEFPDLNDSAKNDLLNTGYAALNSVPLNNEVLNNFKKINNNVLVVLRIDGERKASGFSEEKGNLAKTIYSAVSDALSKTRLKDESKVQLHIFVLGDEKKLDNNFEPGVHGIRITTKDKDKVFDNTYAIETNFNKQDLLNKFCRDTSLSEGCTSNPNIEVSYFSTIHFALINDKLVTFYRGNDLKTGKPDTKEIQDSLNSAKDWLFNNLKDGSFVYVYNPSSGKYSTNNNMVRQLMASRILAESSKNNEDLKKLHKENLDYIFSHWYKENKNFGLIEYENTVKLGSVAMMLRTLVYSPFFEQYKDKAKKLVNTLLYLQNNDGSFNPWFTEPTYKYDKDYLLTFYSGEALLSLIEYYEKTGDKKILDAVIKSADFYVKKYADEIEKNYYPSYVPWHTLALNKLYQITKNKKYAEAIFVMNDKLLQIQNQVGLPYKDFMGRFYNPNFPQYGNPHSASDGVYTEGLAYAYEIAEMLKDNVHMEKYKTAVLSGARNLINLQYRKENSWFMQYPERVYGAIRFNVIDNRVRTDTTQHTVDAFSKILELTF